VTVSRSRGLAVGRLRLSSFVYAINLMNFDAEKVGVKVEKMSSYRKNDKVPGV
jgi:hypothetical protein